MNNIESSNTRASFFPNSKQAHNKSLERSERSAELMKSALKRNRADRIKELENTRKDAKVDISNSIRDFSRIKKSVDATPDVDNSEKIQRLKEQIQNGTYKVNHEELANRLLEQEFRT